MFSILWFLAGLITGAAFHAPIAAASSRAWAWIKLQAAKHGIGRNPD